MLIFLKASILKALQNVKELYRSYYIWEQISNEKRLMESINRTKHQNESRANPFMTLFQRTCRSLILSIITLGGSVRCSNNLSNPDSITKVMPRISAIPPIFFKTLS